MAVEDHSTIVSSTEQENNTLPLDLRDGARGKVYIYREREKEIKSKRNEPIGMALQLSESHTHLRTAKASWMKQKVHRGDSLYTGYKLGVNRSKQVTVGHSTRRRGGAMCGNAPVHEVRNPALVVVHNSHLASRVQLPAF